MSETPDEAPEAPDFAKALERPDHPDFDRLYAVIVDGIDEAARKPGFELEAYVAQYVDPKSLSYIALQRAFLAYQVRDPMVMAEMMPTLMAAAALYLEGFTVGVEFTQGGTESGVLAGVLRKMVTDEEVFAEIQGGDQSGLLLCIDGKVSLEPQEHAVLVDIGTAVCDQH